MAGRVAHQGITVNAIVPGSIRTDINAYLDQEPELFEERLGGIPVGRFGVAEDIAWTVLWLDEPDSSYVTGVVLPVSPVTAEPRRMW